MLLIRLSLIIFDIFDIFYLFLNIFANIDAKKIFIDEILKTLTKIATTYIFTNFLIVLTRIEIQFWEKISILTLRFRATYFAFSFITILSILSNTFFFATFAKLLRRQENFKYQKYLELRYISKTKKLAIFKLVYYCDIILLY